MLRSMVCRSVRYTQKGACCQGYLLLNNRLCQHQCLSIFILSHDLWVKNSSSFYRAILHHHVDYSHLVILNWKLDSSVVYRMASLLCLASQQGQMKNVFLPIVLGLLVVFPARQLKVLCDGSTLCTGLGLSCRPESGSVPKQQAWIWYVPLLLFSIG